MILDNRIIHSVPFNSSIRHLAKIDRYNLYKKKPFKYLRKGIYNTGGHNNSGHITVFSKAARHKRLYRLIDFKRRHNIGVPAIVQRLEYDPNRSSFIALLRYQNGAIGYILAPLGLEIGQVLLYFKNKPLFFISGHCALLADMPFGSSIYGIEKTPLTGAIITRAAGAFAIMLKKEETKCIVRISSGAVRSFSIYCLASVGTVSNKNYKFITTGKAGRMRWLGYKPCVRGVAMNPIDHPHGGGEGKKSGRRCPLSPWGKATKWKKTVSR